MGSSLGGARPHRPPSALKVRTWESGRPAAQVPGDPPPGPLSGRVPSSAQTLCASPGYFVPARARVSALRLGVPTAEWTERILCEGLRARGPVCVADTPVSLQRGLWLRDWVRSVAPPRPAVTWPRSSGGGAGSLGLEPTGPPDKSATGTRDGSLGVDGGGASRCRRFQPQQIEGGTWALPPAAPARPVSPPCPGGSSQAMSVPRPRAPRQPLLRRQPGRWADTTARGGMGSAGRAGCRHHQLPGPHSSPGPAAPSGSPLRVGGRPRPRRGQAAGR